jgi:hypothetical protein
MDTAETVEFHSEIDAVHSYNAKNGNPDFRLRSDLGPCFAEGDPETCSILVLLANPVSHEDSKPSDHTLFFEGWPLAGIHDDAPSWLKEWWRPRLRSVAAVAGDDWNLVSKKVAAINLNPWASKNFDARCFLPSRAYQIKRARRAANRGALIIAVRARDFWLPNFDVDVVRTRNYRCAYISPGNLSEENWEHVKKAMSV